MGKMVATFALDWLVHPSFNLSRLMPSKDDELLDAVIGGVAFTVVGFTRYSTHPISYHPGRRSGRQRHQGPQQRPCT